MVTTKKLIRSMMREEALDYITAEPHKRWFMNRLYDRMRKENVRNSVKEKFYGAEKRDVREYHCPTDYFSLVNGNPSPEAALTPLFGPLFTDSTSFGGAAPPGPVARQDITNITTAPGTTASNQITVPTGYNGVEFWVGELAHSRGIQKVLVTIDGVQTAVECFTFGRGIVRAAAGKVLTFDSSARPKASATVSSSSGDAIKAIGYVTPVALTAPTATTTTVSPDQCAPNVWNPTAAHLVFPNECSSFTIQASTKRRDLFIKEGDGSVSNTTPAYHVHIPANKAVTIQLRFQFVSLAMLTADDLTVNLPAGAITYAGRTVWKPDFTVTTEIICSTLAQFKAAMNNNAGGAPNKIRLTPGVWDLQTAGYEMNSTNYANAMGLDRWIESTSGRADDVIFRVANPGSRGMQWDVSIGSKTWVLNAMSWDLTNCIVSGAGPLGLLDFRGAVHMTNCKVSGPYISSQAAGNGGDAQVKWRSTSGNIVAYAAWCEFTNSSDDITAANVEGGTSMTLHQFGNRIDGNGSYGNSQIVTNHGGGVQVVWGGRFGNLTNPNTIRIISQGSGSPIYLYYCWCRSEDISSGTTLAIGSVSNYNPTYPHFCQFDAISSITYMDYAVCCRFVISGTTVTFTLGSLTSTSFFCGCDFINVTGAGSGNNRIIDGVDANIELFGCRLTDALTTTQQGMIRIYRTANGPWTGTIQQCTFQAADGTSSNPFFVIGTASALLTIKNTIFKGEGNYVISGSVNQVSTIGGSYLQKKTNTATAPNNWNTAFTGQQWASLGSSVKSASDPAIDLDGAPIVSGNCDGIGVATVLGRCDILGRQYLGGTWSPGAVERQEIRSGSYLFPCIW